MLDYSWCKWSLETGGDPFAIERAHDLALKLMAEHGVADWALRIGRGKDEAGNIRYRKVRGRWDGKPGTITLSGPLMSLWTPEQARNTILHEIAHALCPDNGHDATWGWHCARLGIRPERLWGENGEARIAKEWTGTCPGGHSRPKRRGKPTSKWNCTLCSPHALITWSKEELWSVFV